MAWLRTVSFADRPGGATTEHWETAWAAEKQDAPPFLLAELEVRLSGRRRVLEAGCGQAEFVRLLADDGRLVIGLDTAARALAAAHETHPELPLVVGDVRHLPFADGTFDAIVSIGVVEHFEAGPHEVVRAHRALLAADGALFIFVPFRSISRRIADTWHLRVVRRRSYRQRDRIVTRRSSFPTAETDATFHQYEFSRRQFTELLEAGGFEVQHWEPLDPGTAIGESQLMQRVIGARTPAEDRPGGTAPRGGRPASPPTGLRGIAFGHHALSGRGARLLRTVIRRTFGHIQFAVATPRPS